jgi:hypothetical protein
LTLPGAFADSFRTPKRKVRFSEGKKTNKTKPQTKQRHA